MKIITKDNCKYCKLVKEYLDSKDIDYVCVNLSEKENRKAREHYRKCGYTLLPVIENDGWSLEGYNLKLLEEYLYGK